MSCVGTACLDMPGLAAIRLQMPYADVWTMIGVYLDASTCKLAMHHIASIHVNWHHAL